MCHCFPLLLITCFRLFSPIFCLLASSVQTEWTSNYNFWTQLWSIAIIILAWLLPWLWSLSRVGWSAKLPKSQFLWANLLFIPWKYYRNHSDNQENIHWLKERSKPAHQSHNLYGQPRLTGNCWFPTNFEDTK